MTITTAQLLFILQTSSNLKLENGTARKTRPKPPGNAKLLRRRRRYFAYDSYATSWLQDQVDSFTDVFDTQLGLLADVRTTIAVLKRGPWTYCCQSFQLRDLYCDRAALEREYAIKLELLARKVTEKRLKAAAPLVVGNSPRKSDTIKQKSVHVQLLDPPSVLK